MNFDIRRLRPRHLILGAFALVALYVGGTKPVHYPVHYPVTDPYSPIPYLTDAGSYATNDLVHINFTRRVVPDSAWFYLDNRPAASTNDEDWTTVYSNRFADITLPLDIPYPNATNFQWCAYTDWTAGPAVQTNGVWHALMGLDRKTRRHVILLRTAVRVDGETIATPKSKKEAQKQKEAN